MKIKTVLGLAVVLGIVGGAIWGLDEWQKKSLPQPNQAWGSVDVREVSLAFEASGRIRTLLKEEGDRVGKGELLGELDTELLGIQKERAEAELSYLEAQYRLSRDGFRKEDIEKAVKEAEQYAAEDAKIKEKVEIRNQADQLVYQAEKTLSEVGDKVPESEKAPVQAGLDKLKETLKGEDTDAIKAATEELTQLFYKMSEKLYQQAAPQGDPNMGGQPGGDPNGGQQYYDADYKVVDDDDQNK